MITKKVFHDLAIFMIGFGSMIGIVFPFFVVVTGVPSNLVLTPVFFSLCILAGILVGFVNIFLARKIVGKKLITLAEHMKKTEKKLHSRSANPEAYPCSNDECMIMVDSEDEIGESAAAFNSLVASLSEAFKSEMAVRNFTEMLSCHLELEKLSQEALRLLMQHLDAQAGAIILEHSGELKLLSSFGINRPLDLLESDYTWGVLKSQQRSIVQIPEEITLDPLLLSLFYTKKRCWEWSFLDPLIHLKTAIAMKSNCLGEAFPWRLETLSPTTSFSDWQRMTL
jgi:two-component system, cell cycle response regulator